MVLEEQTTESCLNEMKLMGLTTNRVSANNCCGKKRVPKKDKKKHAKDQDKKIF